MRKHAGSRDSGETFRIAVLDDETGIIESISVLLGRMGYRCQGFQSPQEALEALQREPYDLLVLDYMMEGMHGDEVVRKIRAFSKGLYILLLTGHKDIAPPLETLRNLDIQGYCEKSDRFDQLTLLIESGLKAVAQHRLILKYHDGFDRILRTVPKIYQLQPVAAILEELLQGIIPIADSSDAFILIDDLHASQVTGEGGIYRGIGRYHGDVGQFADLLTPQQLEQIGHVRTTQVSYCNEEVLILPLTAGDRQTIGIMLIEGARTEEGKKLCEIYGVQASASLRNAFLYSLVNMKNEELNSTYERLKAHYIEVVEVLRKAVDAKNPRGKGHSDHVAAVCAALGETLGLKEAELELLEQAARLHDIGKIGIEDGILHADGADTLEQEGYLKHAEVGANILSAVSMFKEIVPIVRHHHSRYDAFGQTEDLPYLARILAAADAYDQLRMAQGLPVLYSDSVLEEGLREQSGRALDPTVVDALLRLLKRA